MTEKQDMRTKSEQLAQKLKEQIMPCSSNLFWIISILSV